MIVYLHSIFGGNVDIKLGCPKCGKQIEETGIRVPHPNVQAERASESYSEEEVYLVCGNCGNEIEVTIGSGFADCYIEFHEISDDTKIECNVTTDDEEYFEQLLPDKSSEIKPIEVFREEMRDVNAILESKDYSEKIAKMVYRQLFSSVITIMEAYLLDALVRLIFSNDENKKQFIKRYKEFRETTFSLSEIFDIDVNKNIRNVISRVMYHNVVHVSQLYKCTANIDFGDLREVIQAVVVRHDLVHRNGKTKEGEKVEVGRVEVQKVISDVSKFIEFIDPKIESKIIDPFDLM